MRIFRSVLFAPGDDRKKAGKAFTAGADAVVLDLEDAVAPGKKEAARQTVREVLAGAAAGSPPGSPDRSRAGGGTPSPGTSASPAGGAPEGEPEILDGSPAEGPFRSGGRDPDGGPSKGQGRVPVFVRVNAVSSPYILKDLEAVVDLPIEGIMLAKAESGEEVRRADWLLGLLEREKGIAPGRLVIIPFVESARGIEQAAEIAGACARVWCLAFGGNDYTMDIGTTYSPEGTEQFYARCRLVAASRLAGIAPPLDTVNPDFRNIPALVEEVKRVKQLGFQGKLVIHPAQVGPVNEVFTPSPAEAEWAKKVVAAFAQAQAAGAGVIQLEGRMVELPVVRRAQQILALTEAVRVRPTQD